jgi:carboxypeptidase C (cathepsin A)
VHDAVTRHAITVGGRRIAYTARAGSLLLRDKDNEPTASVFYVAYTADGTNARNRPVTFFWNGGPGSSTIWLHMGSFGPVRVQVPKNATQPGATPVLRDNDATLLDTSDLVFVDAVGTGWSTVVARGKTSDYYGVDEDARAFSQFIERWLTRNGRWQSPKYLFGESYGTTRAANVVNVLQNDGVAVNGVVLLSSALDYNLLPIGNGPGQDLVYIGYLPTEAAVAWYHNKLPGPRPADLPRFLDGVRAFAGGPYAQALRRGDTLDAATRAQMVAQLHAMTGLSAAYIEAANLRIDPNRFQQELLRDEGRNVGDLRSAMVQNPSLHVLSAESYFDLATGFYATEYLLNHMGLNAEQRRRLHYAYFMSGHEAYLNHDALVKFKADLVRFYQGSAAPTSP